MLEEFISENDDDPPFVNFELIVTDEDDLMAEISIKRAQVKNRPRLAGHANMRSVLDGRVELLRPLAANRSRDDR